MTDEKYYTANGISYAGTLPKIKKSEDVLQPLYEAFTNSLEAIRFLKEKNGKGEIIIQKHLRGNLFSTVEDNYDLEAIVIEDAGIGLNESEFERMMNLNDNGKGFSNRGSGRIQFLHFFERTTYASIYEDETSSTGYYQRNITLSKDSNFLRNNAIIRQDSLSEVQATESKTVVTFKGFLNLKDEQIYRELTIEELKQKIINHYLAYLCENRDTLPTIKFQLLINGNIAEEKDILTSDIPNITHDKNIKINYTKVLPDGKSIDKTSRQETLNLKTFKIPKDQLNRNGLFLTSKGEVAKSLKLEYLLADDHIENNRYLFLLSGQYIDDRDGDTRGKINIPTLKEFKDQIGNLHAPWEDEVVLLDDIQEITNNTIVAIHEEIAQKSKEKEAEVQELQAMFLLNPESIKAAKIKINDSDEDILEKVYKADAKIAAQKDAEIKRRFEALDKLNPNSADFSNELANEINELTKAIPLQNRKELTHYVARRKLVLDLFEKVLNRKLIVQQAPQPNYDEALIHNILFQKGSDNPENSDLWLINEDFIYFKGNSEKQLSNITIDGEKVFKAEFSIEEEKYLKSLGENRKIKRPDVLLFPEEGKCIILEFKSPEVNAADHLTQIDFYANLILNYSLDKFQIKIFYGYLIGESIEPRDVLGRVSRYEHSYHLDYLYRPSEKVNGFDGKPDGAIYTEVIKYSTLLKRARMRNSIFINKL